MRAKKRLEDYRGQQPADTSEQAAHPPSPHTNHTLEQAEKAGDLADRRQQQQQAGKKESDTSTCSTDTYTQSSPLPYRQYKCEDPDRKKRPRHRVSLSNWLKGGTKT